MKDLLDSNSNVENVLDEKKSIIVLILMIS